MSDAMTLHKYLSVAAGQPLINSANPAIETCDPNQGCTAGHLWRTSLFVLYVTFGNFLLPMSITVDQATIPDVISHFERQLPPPVPDDSHLRLEMRQWFEGVPMVDARNDAILKALLQDCSFRGAASVHSVLDLLFNGNKLACIISMYSDEEALTFGRFINSILRELLKWHENKDDAYAKFAHGPDKKLPGFGRVSIPIEIQRITSTLKGCLDTGDFQQIRNSLVILTACSGSFPKVDTMALELKQAIEPLARHDERGDIKTTAGSSLALFRDPEKNFQPHHKFCNVPEPARANPIVAHGTSETATARSSTHSRKMPLQRDTNPRHLPSTNLGLNRNNGVQSTQAESTDDDEQKRATPTPTTYALHSREREHVRPSSKLHDPRATTPSKQDKDNSTLSAGAPPGQANRAAHALPIRPDSQPRSRQPERSGGVERPPDHGHHGRYDNRGPPNDYGRLDRSNDPSRPRDGSPGRRGRPVPGGRTPERIPPVVDHREWPTQNTREYDDRGMRAPLRDARAPLYGPQLGTLEILETQGINVSDLILEGILATSNGTPKNAIKLIPCS
ncbi:transcription factor/nuclear export subunit protein 2-domain-containing protein [Phaeosphaeriaceae sp. PMI808]|nr:transcription factor/nuclear export subunit protein 2-domain-containing protein [Phaeosphaeriaceae sp. PMI808]